MRSILNFCLLPMVIFLASCGGDSHTDHEGYLINGSIKGAPKGLEVFLDKVVDNQVTIIDTATTDEEGGFSMMGYVNDKALYSVRYSNNKNILIVLEPGKQHIDLSAGFPASGDYTVSGHRLSANLAGFLNTINFYYTKITGMQQQLNQAYQGGMQETQFIQMQQEYMASITEMNNYVIRYVDTVQSGLLAGFASNMLDPAQHLDKMQKALALLQKEEPGSAYANNMAVKLQGIASTSVGATAPDIQLPDIDGKPLSLSALRGSIVLLDFWASWCGPCRQENPNLVGLYQQYKDKGFKIFSVSLDNDKARWVQAIEKDRLVWSDHVSELAQQRWGDKVMQIYNFNSIPTSYLIDKEGNIIGKDLRGIQLQQKLAEVFAAS